MRLRRIALLGLLQSPAAFAQTSRWPGQLLHDVTLDAPSPLAANAVLLQRLLSPRRQAAVRADMAAHGKALTPYPIDVRAERFTVYLPSRKPAAGYGLLVFIPPWETAGVPRAWIEVLDRAGMIFVTAPRSGNRADVMGRRIPLALTEAFAMAHRYPLDPRRTYVGGLSGGSRVALRTMLAFPDVFAGALLNAGSDPIGTHELPLPSAPLMTILQTRTRFAFVVGEYEVANTDIDARTSLAAWCIDDVHAFVRPHLGHEPMDAGGLAEALAALDREQKPDPARSEKCRAGLDARVARARAEAADLARQPPGPKVDAALGKLDDEYGGLLSGAG